jgi:hypothetical protein
VIPNGARVMTGSTGGKRDIACDYMKRLWSTLSVAVVAAAIAWSPSSRAEDIRGQAMSAGPAAELFSSELRILQQKVQSHGQVWFKSRGWPAVSTDNVEPRKECTIQTHFLIRAQGPVKPIPIESTCQVPIGKIKLSSIRVRPYCRDRHCLAPKDAALLEWENSQEFPCTINEGDNCSTWKDASSTSLRFNSRMAAARAAKAIFAMATACGASEERGKR